MQAMILTLPPQSLQVSMSILNTRFKRCAQAIEARRLAREGPLGERTWCPIREAGGSPEGMTVQGLLC